MNADGACHASSNATLFFHAGKGQSARDVGKSDYEYLTGGEDDGGPADLDEDQEKGDSGFMRGAVPISGFMQVPPNQRSLLKMALAEAGPVSVSIDASAVCQRTHWFGVRLSQLALPTPCTNRQEAAGRLRCPPT